MRRFRVIQGGRQNRATDPGLPRLFKAHSVGNLTRAEKVYHDVKFNWYCLERSVPTAPYENLIADYHKLEEKQANALRREIDHYFTSDEIKSLEAYLRERYGLGLQTEEVMLPVKVKGGFFTEGNAVVYDFIELSEKPDYPLPFKVWGYYTILGCLSTPDMDNAVIFLRKSLELLGFPFNIASRDLESVAKEVYHREGLVVKPQKETV
ncbi:hypothetical protein [Desulfoferrobacter suflitae]|uniref:hypothetical protein n=1 Tax=Desulfoferrobacter suflitae TaxID=2865782 RepID=UPI002164B39E|nr:hypothetical protein [Desulfoferrobacter suflitae]MCK8601055.1 hypothetical protein [Desulfoferrobacter suflitae]